MTLDRIAIALRPRGGYEAIDLGARMLQAWWRPIYAAWFAVYVPVALAVHGALWDYPFLAFLVMLWLKPLFDRFVLHVVSRSVFGDTPTLAATLSAWRAILGPGLVASLTWRRWLDYGRSFTAPVFQLEGQRGAAGRARQRLLGQRLRGYAIWLTFSCFAFMGVIWTAASFVGHELLSVRGPGDGSATPAELFLVESWWDRWDNVTYLLAESLVEPFFVSAGFALYLSRRVMLEGWDVELGLRRMAVRLERRRAGGVRALAALALLAIVAGSMAPGTARADDPEAETPVVATDDADADADEGEDEAEPSRPSAPRETRARETIVAVLADPLFGTWLDARQWRARVDQKPERDGDVSLLEKFGKLLSGALQSLSWVALAGLVLMLVWAIARRLGGHAAEAEHDAAPAELFGLAITPQSLPADVAAAALSLLDQGRVREALSLVYRGALSCLVNRHGLRVPSGDTEGDVVAKAGRMLARPAAQYLAELVRAWIGVAYAGRLPEAEDVRQLCRDYARHFSPIAPAVEPATPEGAPA